MSKRSAMDSIFAAQNAVKQNLGLAKVKVVPNPNYQRHGTKSYVSAMNRYGFNPTKDGPYLHIDRVKQQGLVPAKLKEAIGGRLHKERVLVKRTGPEDASEHGEVTAEDQQNDTEYLCKVAVGTPPVNMMLDFDTGSADLWVFSSSLPKSEQHGHNVYDPKESSTAKALSGKSWKISYGDGSSASGSCVSDTINVGGLAITKQCVECASKLSAQFAQSTGDGLLGLAFSKINTVTDDGEPDPQATPVENLMKEKDVPKESQVFTSAFYSSRDKKPGESFYSFGFIEQDLVKASGKEIAWTKIDSSEGFWMFPSESASIAGKTMKLSGNKAIADTGTTLALMSDEVVEALYKAIPGAKYDYQQQGYVFPTSVTADDLPEFKVAIGDKEFVVQKEDLAFAATQDGKHWYGGVQSRGSNSFDILGDVMLKSVYAIWDLGNTRLGMVPKVEKTQNLTPPSVASSASSEKVCSTDLLGAVE
ncbi:aspartic endopeptidase [Xylariomycetidae sp. FL0641]|nr:aspartic endopeptidase [Xylariomycetidae sp. FL0641]